jgi:protein phosphatase
MAGKTKKLKALSIVPTTPSVEAPLSFASETHTGLVREVNEDSFCYAADPDGGNNALAVVADGIGGHSHGEIASGLCCEHFITSWKRCKAWQFTEEGEAIDFIRATISEANAIIYAENCRRHMPQPMGTTLVAVFFTRASIIVAHAGDSRLYAMRNNILQRLTEDHSYVAEMVRTQRLSAQEAATHPYSHVISKSIGPISDVEPEINIFKRCSGDRFLLCSDGLTAHLTEHRIEEIICSSQTPRNAIDLLMKETLISGAEDNVTLICVF